MIKAFRRVTLLAQSMMAEVLSEGDSAIDATVGTGEDTCFLADCVGASGKVYGFDIQEAALKKANAKLAENKRLPQTTLFCMGHERMNEIFEINHDPKIKGIMFNLGYLPQGDSAIFTQSQTTLKALEQALCLIAPKSLVTICLYRHPAGIMESQCVEDFCAGLGAGFNVHKIETINKNNPPYLIAVEKIK